MWVSQQDLCKDLLHVAAVHHIVGELDYVAVAQDSLLAGLNLLSIDPAAVTAIGVLEVEPASCVVKMLKKWTKWKKTAKNRQKWQQNFFVKICFMPYTIIIIGLDFFLLTV